MMKRASMFFVLALSAAAGTQAARILSNTKGVSVGGGSNSGTIEIIMSGTCDASQTKIHLPLGKNAAGDTVWSDPFKPNTEHTIGRDDVFEAKICGPGKFKFSPLTCGRSEYKPDEFTTPKTASGDCRVVKMNNVA